MKPRSDLIVNSVCFLLLSPVFGMMVGAFCIGIVVAILWVIASVLGIAASLFFDVDFKSLYPRMEQIKTALGGMVIVFGSIGGLIWGWKEVRYRWAKFKVEGKGW